MSQAPNPFDQQKPMENIKHILAISSGKGGVGKSTVTSNLAVALTQAGAKVGLLDADIYGPSIPRMFGCLGQKPEINSLQKLLPVERIGIKIMSLGFLVEDDKAIVWRGPMLFKAIDQLLRDVEWGELDYLLVDLPPGTGDVQLSLCQKVPVSGSITVTTPQNIALMDVKRSIDMFKRLDVPVIGVVENMSYYLTPEGEKLDMFPKGELEDYLTQFNLTKAIEVPFMPDTSQAGEIGIPITQQKKDSPVAKAFQKLANFVLRKLP